MISAMSGFETIDSSDKNSIQSILNSSKSQYCPIVLLHNSDLNVTLQPPCVDTHCKNLVTAVV